MFKVKDDVDLKELEKFCYELKEEGYYEKYIYDYTTIQIMPNRRIYIDYDGRSEMLEKDNHIKDLIKVGLVENAI